MLLSFVSNKTISARLSDEIAEIVRQNRRFCQPNSRCPQIGLSATIYKQTIPVEEINRDNLYILYCLNPPNGMEEERYAVSADGCDNDMNHPGNHERMVKQVFAYHRSTGTVEVYGRNI